jgi:hypothetical protein
MELTTPYFSHSSQCQMSDSIQHSYILMQYTRRLLHLKHRFFFKSDIPLCVTVLQTAT